MTEDNIAAPTKAPVTRKTEAQRKKDLEANRKALDDLCELFPEVFNPRQPKPLKIGIHEDLAATGKLSKTRIRKALNLYVRLRSYYRCMVEGADRIGVEGVAAGQVTTEEAQHAREKLEAIDKRRAERQKNRPDAGARRPASNPRSKSHTPDSSDKPRPRRAAKAKPQPDKTTADKPAATAENSAERLQQKLQALVNKPTNN